MSPRPRPRRLLRLVCLATVLTLGTAYAPVAVADHPAAQDPTQATEPGVYLVTLTGRPAAVHPATRPRPGTRFDRTRPEVAALVSRLTAQQDRVLDEVGEPDVLYRWTTALNGFAVRLDETQVKQLRSDPRVLLVERSTVQRTAGDTADFLGLPGDGGVWQRVGGPDRAGHGTVVGLVDSGIWPENPSFAGLPQQQPGVSPRLQGFNGACEAAERWSPEDCNDKVLSARWFVTGFGADRLASTELLSPRDTTGHGSHAASTVAGARRVDVTVDRQRFGDDSGMAPAARLAVYKACWTAPDPADDGCATADTATAVDQAVADGVDVLGYAVSGSGDPRDTLSRAFLAAATAGVFVAAAAGNQGPGHGTVGNAAPWVTTVGASTHRTYQGAVRLGDGTSLVGAMVSDRRVPQAPLVHGRDAAAPPTSAQAAARCELGSLDAAAVEGRIVVCDRGVVPRVDKSAAVARAGGLGMVLLNTTPDTVEADVHAVPTVHLTVDDAGRLRSYLRADGREATARLDPAASERLGGPRLAPFSARGPVGTEDALKPDLTAPGVSVLGAVAPPADEGRLWSLRSGTSVATAHVAGLAAVLRSRHPAWSPARIRSAMTTTADPLAGAPGPFAEGAGQVDPAEMLDPGVVLDAGPVGYRRFLHGTLPAHELNTTSVVVGDLVGTETVVRRLTNVSGARDTYTATVSGLDGVQVSVQPSTVTLRPGQTRAVRIRLTATPDAPVREFTRGRISWTGLRHQARVPVLVRAAPVAAPSVVDADLDRGRVTVKGRSGTGTRVLPRTLGLASASPLGISLQPRPFEELAPPGSDAGAGSGPAADPGAADGPADEDTFATSVPVPTGAEAARFEVTSHNAADDLDLRVFHGEELVGEATGPGPAAVVTLPEPQPGDYRVEVHAVRAGNGAVATGELTTWVVSRSGADELQVVARSQGDRPGAPFRYRVSWPELDPTQRWFAVLRYPGTDRRTYLRIG